MHFDYKVSGLKNFKLDLPVLTLDKKAENRVLFVSDFTSKFEKDVYLNSDTGTMLNNAIMYALDKTEDSNAKKFLAFNYYPFEFKNYLELPEGNQQEIQLACKKRLLKFIKQTKPDIIVFSGRDFVDPYFFREPIIDTLPLVNKSRISNEDMFSMHGRLFDATLAGHNCKIMHTLSIRDVCAMNPKNYDKVELLGFFIYDLSTAFYGENRYTLPQLKPKGDWYSIISTYKEWQSFFEKLKNSDILCFDTEAKNLNRRYGNCLLTAQFGLDGKHGWVLPYDHKESPFSSKEKKKIAKDIKYYFESCRSKYHVMHNGQFDCHLVKQIFGIEFFNHNLLDTMGSMYFLDENRRSLTSVGYHRPFSLGHISLEYGGLAYLDSTLGKKDRKNMSAHSLEDIAEYGGVDAIYPYHIAQFGLREAKRRGPMYKGYKNAVIMLGGTTTYSFVEMEHNGIHVDRKYLRWMTTDESPLVKGIKDIKDKFKKSKIIDKLNKELAYEAGFKSNQGLFGTVETPWIFDIGKKNHQHRLFFDKLGLEPLNYGASGDGSVDDAFLKEYISVPEVALLADLRKQEKVYSSNIVSYLKYVEEDEDCAPDSCIRSTYNYHTIVTNRTSSNNPNQQNVVSRGPYAKPIKKQFKAKEGYIVLDYDLNANEVKNWGNVSQDKNISESFSVGMLLRRKLRIWSHKYPKKRDKLVTFLNKVKWFEKDGPSIEDKIKLSKSAKYSTLKTALKILVDLEIGGDVHKKNYSFFFGIPASEVTPVQRQAVKNVVFGVLYGKSPESLSRDIEPSRAAEAKKELNKVEEEIRKLEEMLKDR